jgi:glycosyltransferase involved in cell wall biosynthesis
MVDPSLFGLLYDIELCEALAGAGAGVTLVGRPLRVDEERLRPGFAFAPLFYPGSEALARRGGRHRLAALLKGLEHARGLAALAALARRERPDVVHLQWLTLPLLDDLAHARLARRAPLVLTVHDSAPFLGTPSSPLQLLGYDRALRRFAHYLAHTPQTVRYLEGRGVPAGRISLLPHPPHELPPSTAAPPRDGLVRILLFGALKPYKGIDILVEAGLALARHRRDFHITVAGRPFCDLAPLRARIAAAGADALFTFEPRFIPDSELADLVGRADLVVFPYRRIDASGALTLAARAGRPILATAVGGFAEPPLSEHLRLLPPEDAAALAAALDELIRDPAARDRLAAASRELAAALPSWPAFARACLEIYRRLPRR